MLVCKYIFDNSIYDNLIPVFNDGYNGYTISDEVDGSYTTRTIECDTLPTQMRFGDTSWENTDTIKESSLLEVLEANVENITTMFRMFGHCTSLAKVNLNNVTNKTTNLQQMFHDCFNLTQLDTSNWDISNVTNIQGVFQNCTNLEELDVSNWNVNKVTDMRYIFNNCSKLTSLDVSNWNVGNITDTTSMFNRCTNLTKLNISNWDTSKVTNMENMFYNCQNLTQLDISNFDISNVINMNNTFANISKLQYIKCNNQSTINKISSLLPTKTSDSQGTIICKQSDEDLQSIDMDTLSSKNWNVTNETEIIATYVYDTKIYSNLIPTFNSGYVYFVEQDVDDENGIRIRTLEGLGLPTLMRFGISGRTAYSNQLALLEILMLKTDSLTTMQHMFNNCPNLTYINCDFNTFNVVNMIYTFRNCSVKELNLSNWDTSKVTNMTSIFDGCENLIQLDLSSWNVSNVTNMSYMFFGCINLISIKGISNWNTSKVDNMSYICQGCYNLTELDVSNWDTSNVTNMTAMFRNCQNLSYLDVSNWDISNVTNMGYILDTTNNLTDIGMLYCSPSTINTISSALPNDINRTIYYQDANINSLTPYSHIQYKEYKETNAMINLSSLLLEGDTIEVVDGKLCHVHRYGKVVLDGSEDEEWEKSSSDSTTLRLLYTPQLKGAETRLNVICDNMSGKAFGIQSDFEAVCLWESGKICLKVFVSRLSTPDVESFKQWLQDNPITVVYKLANSYYEDITPIQSQFVIETLEEGNMEILTNLPIKINISYNVSLHNTASLEEELNIATMNNTDLTNLLEDEINN